MQAKIGWLLACLLAVVHWVRCRNLPRKTTRASTLVEKLLASKTFVLADQNWPRKLFTKIKSASTTTIAFSASCVSKQWCNDYVLLCNMSPLNDAQTRQNPSQKYLCKNNFLSVSHFGPNGHCKTKEQDSVSLCRQFKYKFFIYIWCNWNFRYRPDLASGFLKNIYLLLFGMLTLNFGLF